MKHACFLLIVLSIASVAGQVPKYNVNPNPVYTYFVSDNSDHVGEGILKNNSKTTIYLLWTKENVVMPQDWFSAVCDCNNCYSHTLEKCPDNLPGQMKPNDTCKLQVHVSENGKAGEAHVIVWLYEKSDTTVKYRADYFFNKILSTKENKAVECLVYPNPASDLITVETNQQLKRVEWYTLLGKNVMAKNAVTEKTYDVSALADGLYFLKLIGSDERIIQTMRIQKNSNKNQ